MTKSRHNKRSSSRSTSGGSQSAKIDVLHQDMKSLIELQKAQETKFVPEQMDVPRIRFKQGTIFNVELSYILNVTSSNSAPTNAALVFQLNNAVQSGGYLNIFDRYRIIQVNVKMMPTGGTGAPLYTVIDYDDATPLGGLANYLGYATLKITPVNVVDERTLVPRIAAAAYNGAFAGYANLPQTTWIDAASPGVQYYGLKYFVPQATGNTYQFVVTMMVQFKSQRSS